MTTHLDAHDVIDHADVIKIFVYRLKIFPKAPKFMRIYVSVKEMPTTLNHNFSSMRTTGCALGHILS